jgi:hypothetical protein
MTDINDVMKEFGIESDVPKIKNTGSSFHVFEPGEYIGLVGKFNIQYIDAEKKKCEKDKPGAKPGYGMLDILVVKDPNDTVLINKDYSINQEVDYGAHIFKQYITLDSDKQWVNKQMFESFYIDDAPIKVVIEDGGEYEIALGSLPAFVGMPCTFSITEGKKKNSRFLGELELKIHTLTKELLAQRKKAVEKLYEAILAKKPVKADKEEEVEDVTDPEDLLSQFEG